MKGSLSDIMGPDDPDPDEHTASESLIEGAGDHPSTPPVDLAVERQSRRAGPPREKSQSTQLVELARSRFEVVKDRDGRVYAVDRRHPGIAVALRGADGVRQQVASVFYDTHNRAASGAALSDMLNVIEGDALKARPTPVFLRVGSAGGVIYLDTASTEGTVVCVDPTGWRTTQTSPVLFRRSALTSPLPDPIPSDTDGLHGFRTLLNVNESGFRLIVGWLVAALVPEIPHPILALLGQQGTAKTTAMTMLASLVDPSTAPARTPPRDEDSWGPMALHSWIIGLDNISRLAPWFQDALCKAVTGDGIVRRAKYTDDDVSVQRFKRPIALTSIDPGALNGDVADRLLSIELEPISRTQRRTDASVRAEFDRAAPYALGRILDLLVGVLAALPNVTLTEMPRMADFARILAALDQVTGWSTLIDYLAATEAAAQSVVDSDLFASALKDFVTRRGSWEGTASQLAPLLAVDKPPRGWPTTPQAVGGRLRRIAPAMIQVGVLITERPRLAGSGGRGWLIRNSDVPASRTARLCVECGETLSPLLATEEVRHMICAENSGKTTTEGSARQ